MISVGFPENFNLEEFLEASDGENGNISGKVYFFILKEIFRGGYKVGSRITEAQIVEKLSVSNGPVREAFARLRSDGWIETIPNMGSIIIDYHNPEKYNNLFKDRRIIEVGCSVELSETASYRQLAELEEAVHDIEKSLSTQDHSLYRDADLRFHCKVVESVASQRLFNLWRHSTLQLFCFGYSYMPSEDEALINSIDLKLQEASHQALFKAVASRDAEKTRRLFLVHLDYPIRYVENFE